MSPHFGYSLLIFATTFPNFAGEQEGLGFSRAFRVEWILWGVKTQICNFQAPNTKCGSSNSFYQLSILHWGFYPLDKVK